MGRVISVLGGCDGPIGALCVEVVDEFQRRFPDCELVFEFFSWGVRVSENNDLLDYFITLRLRGSGVRVSYVDTHYGKSAFSDFDLCVPGSVERVVECFDRECLKLLEE